MTWSTEQFAVAEFLHFVCCLSTFFGITSQLLEPGKFSHLIQHYHTVENMVLTVKCVSHSTVPLSLGNNFSKHVPQNQLPFTGVFSTLSNGTGVTFCLLFSRFLWITPPLLETGRLSDLVQHNHIMRDMVMTVEYAPYWNITAKLWSRKWQMYPNSRFPHPLWMFIAWASVPFPRWREHLSSFSYLL